MRTHRHQRGAGLLEAMIAMGVLMIGAAGLVGMTRQSTFFMSDSRRTTRAATFAQDLINQIELWDFDDPRLANSQPGNDKILGDPGFLFAHTDPPNSIYRSAVDDGFADHGEADLAANGKTWSGLPGTALATNDMQRYWNVAYEDDFNGNGIPDAVRITVIVRWPVSATGYNTETGTEWHRVVFTSTKINPGDSR